MRRRGVSYGERHNAQGVKGINTPNLHGSGAVCSDEIQQRPHIRFEAISRRILIYGRNGGDTPRPRTRALEQAGLSHGEEDDKPVGNEAGHRQR